MLTSCFPLEKTIKESYKYELYIDYKFVSYEGKNSTQTVLFEIDSVQNSSYFGKVIVNEHDTLLIDGFEKGDYYISDYRNKRTGEIKLIEIWCPNRTAQIPDSIEISEWDTIAGFIKEKTILFRQPRNGCF